MRIPADHYLLHAYLDKFGLNDQLFPFEMENKVIYLSGMPAGQRTMTYAQFNNRLVTQDPVLLGLFPGLRNEEKGKTCDDLFDEAVQAVKNRWQAVYAHHGGALQPPYTSNALAEAYRVIIEEYDNYTLRTYLTDVAGWSNSALDLYDLGNAHVVFENSFIESFKDAFLSSNNAGSEAGMQQLQSGMDAVPKAFLNDEDVGIDKDIIFGARVKRIRPEGAGVRAYYDNPSGGEFSAMADYLVLAIPYTAQRTMSKDIAFTPRKEMAVRTVRYVEVTKVLLQYRSRWWRDSFTQLGQGTDGGVVCDLPIRYTMFPKEEGNQQFVNNARGAIMAAYTFEQDATILGSLAKHRRIALAARNIATIFPGANSLDLLEAGISQVFPIDEFAGGSAFCYFGPMQKSRFLEAMCETDWEDKVFFAGEQASSSHGWIEGAIEAGLRCVFQIIDAAAGEEWAIIHVAREKI